MHAESGLQNKDDSRVELIRTRNQELRLLFEARNTRDGCGMNRMLSGNLNLFKED